MNNNFNVFFTKTKSSFYKKHKIIYMYVYGLKTLSYDENIQYKCNSSPIFGIYKHSISFYRRYCLTLLETIRWFDFQNCVSVTNNSGTEICIKTSIHVETL